METTSDINLQKIFAFSDEVCARDLLLKQFDILEIQETVIPDNIVGSTIEVPFKYIELIKSLIKCNYPNLGINLKAKQILPTNEQLLLPIIIEQVKSDIPIKELNQNEYFINNELTNIDDSNGSTEIDETIVLTEIQIELNNLRLDTRKNCDNFIQASKDDANQLNNTLLNINKSLFNITEKLQILITGNEKNYDILESYFKYKKNSK